MMRERQAQYRGAARSVHLTRRGFAARATICTALSALALGAFPGPAAAIINAPPLVSPNQRSRPPAASNSRGSVDPYGLDTTYHFEYGTTTAYGTNVPAPDADAGSNEGFIPVSQTVTGLAPSTTYHFRLFASNSAGPNTSKDETFTIPANPNAPPPPSNQFSVGAATTKGQSAMLAVTVAGAGTVSASGKDLRAVSATATGAGSVKLNLKLSGGGSKALKKAKNHKLRLKISISFLPTGGSAASATKTSRLRCRR